MLLRRLILGLILFLIGFFLYFIFSPANAEGFYFGYNHSGPDDLEDIKTILVGFETASNFGVQFTYGILDEELNDFNYAHEPPTNLHSPKRHGDTFYDGNPIGVVGTYRVGPVVAGVGGMWVSRGNVFLSEDGSRYWHDAPDDDILFDASLGLRHAIRNISFGIEYSILRGAGANLGWAF